MRTIVFREGAENNARGGRAPQRQFARNDGWTRPFKQARPKMSDFSLTGNTLSPSTLGSVRRFAHQPRAGNFILCPRTFLI